MFFSRRRSQKKGSKEPDTNELPRGRSRAAANPFSGRFSAEDERPTTDLSALQSTPILPDEITADGETRILLVDSDSSADKPANNLDDPPVGWLVVIDGPGTGNAVTIGYGMNSVGRNPKERVSLNFGDEQISRERHALVTYDGKSRRFFVQHGGGSNLTHLGNEPVLTPQELQPGDLIRLGKSTLRFVPLCSAEFDWVADVISSQKQST